MILEKVSLFLPYLVLLIVGRIYFAVNGITTPITLFEFFKDVVWFHTGILFCLSFYKKDHFSPLLTSSLIACLSLNVFIFLRADNFIPIYIFKGLAHMFVGILATIWYVQKDSFYINILLGLFVFEIVIFLLTNTIL